MFDFATRLLRKYHPAPAFDLDTLKRIHADYLASAAVHPDREVWLRDINDSEFARDLISRRAGKKDDDLSWTNLLLNLLQNNRFEPHHDDFAGSMLAAAADALLRAGRATEALSFAELAFAHSIYDLWVQRVLTAVRAHARGTPEIVDETEQWLKTKFCSAPFDTVETISNSQMAICCPLWLPVSIGGFKDKSIEEALNSKSVQLVRKSIVDGSYRYCSRVHCVRITERDLPSRESINLASLEATVYPKYVTFSHDQSCNLSCPSCRGHVVIVPKSQRDNFISIPDFLLPLMLNAESVKICGSGDPFASWHFRSLLKAYCSHVGAHRNIVLHTNGVLCDQRSWSALGLSTFVKTVMVSLDAAEEETYSYTRRGGQWRRVLDNIRFLSQLKIRGAIDTIELLFVVQNRNFREMIDFVHLAKSLGADKVLFQAITNWGTYSEIEFEEHNIFSLTHPNHQALLELLNDEIFDDPIVDLFSVGKFRKKFFK
ncbi:pyruvate-formate lyase-activating enzyme [Rhodoblastus acidophilus]|uniref:radical SAM protein n=1 Tax=Rhodoblastus acidophilus TaxID=1074 RepID=UPI00222530C7|nr:radical SAM protein [Rhodoblastus acidophilus]MCW2283755.1 pyruvate-formate lyase-activating enzyme [Rhodoblastus acidophilus]MCW2332896.1 pyruvate-formate lyase-activating enzyme [Rhodoblastus acidophilus]